MSKAEFRNGSEPDKHHYNPSQAAVRSTFAVCLADFGDSGVAFIASPQIPPRNTNWASKGKWVRVAKIAFEKYFLRKVRQGRNEPFWEKQIMKWIGAEKLKDTG